MNENNESGDGCQDDECMGVAHATQSRELPVVIDAVSHLVEALKLGVAIHGVMDANADAHGFQFMLVRRNPDGTGQSTCQFNARDFLRDLDVLLAHARDGKKL